MIQRIKRSLEMFRQILKRLGMVVLQKKNTKKQIVIIWLLFLTIILNLVIFVFNCLYPLTKDHSTTHLIKNNEQKICIICSLFLLNLFLKIENTNIIYKNLYNDYLTIKNKFYENEIIFNQKIHEKENQLKSIIVKLNNVVEINKNKKKEYDTKLIELINQENEINQGKNELHKMREETDAIIIQLEARSDELDRRERTMDDHQLIAVTLHNYEDDNMRIGKEENIKTKQEFEEMKNQYNEDRNNLYMREIELNLREEKHLEMKKDFEKLINNHIENVNYFSMKEKKLNENVELYLDNQKLFKRSLTSLKQLSDNNTKQENMLLVKEEKLLKDKEMFEDEKKEFLKEKKQMEEFVYEFNNKKVEMEVYETIQEMKDKIVNDNENQLRNMEYEINLPNDNKMDTESIDINNMDDFIRIWNAENQPSGKYDEEKVTNELIASARKNYPKERKNRDNRDILFKLNKNKNMKLDDDKEKMNEEYEGNEEEKKDYESEKDACFDPNVLKYINENCSYLFTSSPVSKYMKLDDEQTKIIQEYEDDEEEKKEDKSEKNVWLDPNVSKNINEKYSYLFTNSPVNKYNLSDEEEVKIDKELNEEKKEKKEYKYKDAALDPDVVKFINERYPHLFTDSPVNRNIMSGKEEVKINKEFEDGEEEKENVKNEFKYPDPDSMKNNWDNILYPSDH